MSTNRHLVEQAELMAYLDGELPTDQATTALAHLEQCAECQALATDLRSVSQQLLVWEVDQPDSRIPAKISAALEPGGQESVSASFGSQARQKRVFLRRWGWVAAFAILCVVVALTFK